MYDVVLRGGEVVDGSGDPRYRADVAVKDGLIAAVGTLDEPSRRTIDAEGLVVTPGFVDGHTHLDAYIERYDHRHDVRRHCEAKPNLCGKVCRRGRGLSLCWIYRYERSEIGRKESRALLEESLGGRD